MAGPTEIERDLQALATELRRLEGEYNMFFGGRVPRPPHETRARVEAMLKRLDRAVLESVAQRFRLQTLQARYASFTDLWDRGLRSRESGRRGPFRPPASGSRRPGTPTDRADEQIVHEQSLTEPLREMDRLEALYDAVMEARRRAGEAIVPFHKFAELIREEVSTLRDDGAGAVAFRVAIREGKVRLTARATKNAEK